jgi:peroxiredoxin
MTRDTIKPGSLFSHLMIRNKESQDKTMFKKIRAILLAGIVASTLVVQAGAQQDFIFLTADGQTVSLSSLRGKVVVLLFGGAQDPQCREELRALESLGERYRGKDVAIYWVTINSPKEMSDADMRNPCGVSTAVAVLRDKDQAAFRRYSGKVQQLPTLVVLDSQGALYRQPRGGFNPNSDFINDLAGVIDSLLRK